MDNNGFDCYFNNGCREMEIMKYAIECLLAALKLNKNVSDLTNLVGCLPNGLRDSLQEVCWSINAVVFSTIYREGSWKDLMAVDSLGHFLKLIRLLMFDQHHPR